MPRAKSINENTENQNQETETKTYQTFQTIEELESNLDNITSKYKYKSQTAENTEAAKDAFMKVVNVISEREDVSPLIVTLGFAEILQSGGHIRGVTIRKAIIGSWDITKKQILNTLSLIRCNHTLRAIARANNKLIAKISLKRGIPGNLYPQYKTTNPTIITQTEETQLLHAVYCVDFQKDNNDAPEEVLKFLNEREIEKKKKKKASTDKKQQ